MSNNKIYLKGLNGIRAIAALGVLLSHINTDFPFLTNINIEKIASFSVTFFFALSGFLITYLLLKEKEKTDTISLQKFYLRRILRIWPLYYGYLLVVFLVTVFVLAIYKPDINILYCIFFTVNISMALGVKIMPATSHYWSLGVEEQFYIFWPLLVKYSKKPKYVILAFLIGYIGLKVSLKIIPYQLDTLATILNKTKFDAMAIGGLAACFLHEAKPYFFKITNHIASQIIAIGIISLIFFDKTAMFFSIFEHDVVAIAIATIIINQCANPKPIFSLENKVFDFLGKISFGIYVYHVFFILLLQQIPLSKDIQPIVALSVIPIVTIVVAYLSYQYYEMPFLHIKEKFTVIESSNSSSNKAQ